MALQPPTIAGEINAIQGPAAKMRDRLGGRYAIMDEKDNKGLK